MRTTLEGSTRDGSYFCMVSMSPDEVGPIGDGGPDAAQEMSSTALEAGKAICRKGGECALKAYLRVPREDDEDPRYFIEISCQDEDCPKPDLPSVGAALRSLEDQADMSGISHRPMDYY